MDTNKIVQDRLGTQENNVNQGNKEIQESRVNQENTGDKEDKANQEKHIECSDQVFDAIIKDATRISELYNTGAYLEANIDLPDLLTKICDQFKLLTDQQKKLFSGLMSSLCECQNRRDYLSLADFLRFELPYILSRRL